MGDKHRVDVLEQTLSMVPTVPLTMVVDFTKSVLEPHDSDIDLPQVVEVTAEKTQDALLRFQNQKITILNFASGVSPGGGVRYGARAQEEDICLCSNLLLGLEDNPDYYEHNQTDEAPAECYDKMLVSRNVTFCLDGALRVLETYRDVDVITYPAPNMGRLDEGPARGPSVLIDGIRMRSKATKEAHREAFQKTSPQDLAREVFARRTRHIVHQAVEIGTEVLILGAWGCGAYGNNPDVVAQAFKQAILEQGAALKKVVFAIYGDTQNQQAFHRVFSV